MNRPTTKSIQLVLGAEGIAIVSAKSNGLCFWCGGPSGKFTIDHIIPTVCGGTDDPSNLVLSCRSCNCAKSAKSPIYHHKFKCLRRLGYPRFITVRVMQWFIDNHMTDFQWDPVPWDLTDDQLNTGQVAKG